MELEDLKKLYELLVEWEKQYPFTEEHEEIIAKVILWVSNLIKGDGKTMLYAPITKELNNKMNKFYRELE